MQKLEKRASILLWAIFLSMAIFIAFVSINHQISKNLEENNKISEIISLNNEKNLKINEAIEKDLANIKLFHDEIIIFEDNNHQI
jgi:putative exporter of polyketide antibiotics